GKGKEEGREEGGKTGARAAKGDNKIGKRKNLKLETAVKYMNAEAAELTPALQSLDIRSFSIDSREVQAGDVFFALSQPDYRNNGFNGDFEDATRYVVPAFAKGAVACVVRRDRFDEHHAELEPFTDRLIF